ncbi:uncharacterized protein LOC115628339 [Scaptodrosophila lebanonensis]|uniref:Uncharacterized protein LOC115628339 n=1 Tax=Drosophila lebanonensis TaxID=7225 RepID=A0A6J2TZK6_DROLE|nr:uncharacterized protein LOC115628339 [Scaptodrosophila lebanonensis]
MAALVHGCSSPRQRSSFKSDVLVGGNGGSSASPNAHHSSTPAMYTTMPKYSRTASQTLYATTQQIFGNGGAVADNQYNGPLYMSTTGAMSSIPQQRPLSASALPESSAACRNYWSHQQHPSAAMLYHTSGRHYNKRKSAVELLAESKPFYIKSDAIFERLQQTSGYRTVGTGTTTNSVGVKRGRRPEDGHYNPTYEEIEDRRFMTMMGSSTAAGNRSASQIPQQQSQQYMHHHHHHHHGRHHGQQHATHSNRHSATAAVNNNLLQHKLRMLLGSEANKERQCGANTAAPGAGRRHDLNDANAELLPAEYDDDGSPMRIPPPLYMPTHSFANNSYNYPSEPNSGGEEPLVLTENYRPISPPAEYAAKSGQPHNERYRYNYQRSYSHSHEVADTDERAPYTGGDYNINSHKSLPDLHTQISRHSPHSEILSCCSRGNRSIKSAGESSINRDSGGSSGHYTHRSEPCYKRQREVIERDPNASSTIKNCCNLVAATRRDSGSSTQHSANSYCGYVTPADYPPLHIRNADCLDCRCKPDPGPMGYDSNAAADYLLNFTPTPEVPEAFQDDYTPTPPSPSPRLKTQTPRYSSSSSQQLHTSSQGYTSINHSQSSLVQSPGSAPSVDDISPPPIQFKRQRCIRFKNRNRLPAQPRTSPINNVDCMGGSAGTAASAGYKRSTEHENVFFPKGFATDGYTTTTPSQSHVPLSAHTSDHAMDVEREALNASISELEKFFDRLGLNDEAFHEIYSQPRRTRSTENDSDDSSTVFFSDVSTVDSMRLPDSTETQPQTTQPYRPSEPPSIVERNARIIKWLCNCKKMQCA